VEVIVLRAAIRKPLQRKFFPPEQGVPQEPLKDQRLYSFAADAEQVASTVHRSALRIGERLQGPAVIYESTTTTYVDADFSYGLDANGCVLLTREEGVS